MRGRLMKLLKRTALLLAVVIVTLFAVRVYISQSGAPLKPWHTFVPHEMNANVIDGASWADYLRAEDKIFADVLHEVSQKLDADERIPVNRYFEGSPVNPESFSQDWNRSYVLEPDGPPAGAVVFLHGLTDSPYSLRHIARRYREHGYVSIAIRLPAHGTVPGALTDVEWQDWMAATRLAVREAKRRIGPSLPLHMIGFSTGGTLALKYALDALEDPKLARPDRLVLISPMIGIRQIARFAGLAGLPSIIPAFAKAAWLSVLPEFNPFKYNSFPVNGAQQSYLLSNALQQQITRLARAGRLDRLAPLLTFQSVIDFTVSTRAIVNALYAQLPSNGSEIVLFDLNRIRQGRPTFTDRLGHRLDASSASAAAAVQNDDHRQCKPRQQRGGRARDRGRRRHGTITCFGAVLSTWRLLALACRPAVSNQRFALWNAAGSCRELRCQPRRHCPAWRAGHADRQPGCVASHVLKPLLPLHDCEN